ncbi:DNA-binding GntR family transcriptional regulator [Pullulanibacillus pueri]|uniref:GntR family transcriptional regulator n=1 Tax=Pullulanibacillus pueri TaxID=1437324 RepID=A0A8J2ZUT3_9BACL|nr:GntR family transcriptional regulator [Pullulanibacillus pueri]MBM7682098.1 DNA-binding GntR family transcriptional regulator [Pullulanibacillus pueri]GGH79989.1 GntR family transcriptional regulator [Pullulanibacillus pueri]
MNKPLKAKFERSKATTDVLNKLRIDIILGKYSPGTRLIENTLAKDYQVSRGRIRDVFKVLEQEGIIESLDNGATVVVGFNEEIASDMYDLRLYLELKATEILLSKKMVSYSQLVSALDRVANDLNHLNLQDLYDIDIQFHRGLFIAAGNRPIMQAWDNLSSTIHSFLSVNTTTEYSKNYAIEFFEKHKIIIDAIIMKNPKAKEEVEKHILDAKQMTLDIIKKQGNK